MSDFCSMCMKAGTYHGFIMKRESTSMILDGSYCDEHMIVRLKQVLAFMENPTLKKEIKK